MVNNSYTLLYRSPNVPCAIILPKGLYKIECWGASGGYSQLSNNGRGAFVSGLISFKSVQKLYLYVGEQGSCRNKTETYNGGGGAFFGQFPHSPQSYSCSGGGATDVRLSGGGNWDDFESLKTRIIVSGGGGGEVHFYDGEHPSPRAGGFGGNVTGGSGNYSHFFPCSLFVHQIAEGGKQEKGGRAGVGNDYGSGAHGLFGKGGTTKTIREGWPCSGGGGGYFGGGSGGVSSCNLGSGAGGSSFVSGMEGYSAMTQNSTETKMGFKGSIHFSGHSFFNIKVKSGEMAFPSPEGTGEIGHFGNGAIKITLITLYYQSCKNKPAFVSLTLSFVLIQIYSN